MTNDFMVPSVSPRDTLSRHVYQNTRHSSSAGISLPAIAILRPTVFIIVHGII